jgi:hypothetical protein
MAISPPLFRPGTTPQTSHSERRRHPRAVLPGKHAVALTLNRVEAGSVLDVSESGIGIASREPLRFNSTVAINFAIPASRERVEAAGVVAWTTPSGRAGIRFLQVPQSGQKLLEGWLARASEERTRRLRVESRVTSDPEVRAVELAINSRHLELDDALSLIAERARVLTRADGAAIALLGDKGYVCRAASGNAPDLGVYLTPDSGLSGECIRGGKTVRCDDTEEDFRADKIACRALDLRSTVIVPIVGQNDKVTGILEVLSSSARNFAGRDVFLLRQFAALVTRTAAAVEVARAAAAGVGGVNSVIPPLSQPPTASRSAAGKLRPTLLPNGHIVCDSCGHDNPPNTRVCEECDVPFSTAIDNPGLDEPVKR